MSKSKRDEFRVEILPHAIIVRGTVPVFAMQGLKRMARGLGLCLIDVAVTRPLRGATLVMTDAKGSEKLREDIAKEARRKADGDALEEWLWGSDTGTSSLTIAEVMTGRKFLERRCHPWDSGGFGRCLRLVDRMPGWRERLSEVAVLSSSWAAIVGAWDELEQLYNEEAPSGAAAKCYRRMKELLREAHDE